MDWNDHDRGAFSISGLSWRSQSQHSPCRSSASSTKRLGQSRRTKKSDSSSDIPTFTNRSVLFREVAPWNPREDLTGLRTLVTEPEDINKRNRMMEWLEELRNTMDLPSSNASLLGQEQHRSHENGVEKSGQFHRQNNAGRSSGKSPHGHSPSAICKLPCQSCGTQIVPATEQNVPTLSRHDRLSRSVRKSAPTARSDALIIEPPQPEWKGWKKSSLSKSARHPQMAAPEASLPGDIAPPLIQMYTKNPRLSKSARHPHMAVDDVACGTDKLKMPISDVCRNKSPTDSQPKMAYSASCRENGTASQGRNQWFHDAAGVQPALTNRKDKGSELMLKPRAGNTVQHWFSQLLGKSPRKLKQQTVETIIEEPEQLKAGATIGDVLNRKGLVTETTVIVKSSCKASSEEIAPKTKQVSRPPLPIFFKHQEEHATMRQPVEQQQLTIEDQRESDRVKESERLLSPPKRRKEVASRLAKLVKADDLQQENISSQHSTEHEKISDKHNLKFDVEDLNDFLKCQRNSIVLQASESSMRITIISSGHDSSVSSMVCAICYAWMLENVAPESAEKWTSVPLINVARHNMWSRKQAAWLFDKCGLDTRALLFRDEVNLENLSRSGQYTVLTVGQDILNTKAKVASSCTLLCEKYSKELPQLLDVGFLKLMLIAGLLLDTQNLDCNSVFCTPRDQSAMHLLLKDTGPKFRTGFYTDLKQKHDNSGFQALLCESYGQRPIKEPIPEEEEEDVPDTANKLSKEKTTTKPNVKLRARSQSPSTTDYSEPFTADLDTSPSSVAESAYSNNSYKRDVEDISTKQGHLQLKLNATIVERKTISERKFGRFFGGFGRSRYTVVA